MAVDLPDEGALPLLRQGRSSPRSIFGEMKRGARFTEHPFAMNGPNRFTSHGHRLSSLYRSPFRPH